MKAAVVFDCHLWPHKRFGGPLRAGNNRRGQLTLQTLHAAVDGANEEDSPLIVAGDLVDEAGPIWPQFGAAIRAELGRTAKGVYLIPGNHDMTAADDHSLRIYEECSQQSWVRVVDDHFRLGDIDLVPFHCDFTSPKVEAPIVIGHFGVFDDDFPAFMKKSHEAWHVARLFAFLRERGIRCCALGDWHSRFLWSLHDSIESSALPQGTQHRSAGRPKADQGGWLRAYDPDTRIGQNLDGSAIWPDRACYLFQEQQLILQGGSLCPTGWDNKGMRGYGTLAIIDSIDQSLSWRELPGPRFCTAYEQLEEEQLTTEAKQLGHQLFLRRYFDGAKPEQPADIEAYEPLPITLRKKAQLVLGVDSLPTAGRLEALVTEWLDEMRAIHGEEAALHEKLLRRYL